MRKLIFAGLSLLLVSLVFSCTSFKISGLTVNKNAPSYTKLGDFSTKAWVNKFLGGSGGNTLFNISEDAADKPVREAIQDEITKLGGDAAINVTLSEFTNLGPALLNALTSAIWAPSEVLITGTVIKYN